MKLVFSLTEKQLARAVEANMKNALREMEVRKNFTINTFTDSDGNSYSGYINEIGIQYVWQGSILGFIKAQNQSSFIRMIASIERSKLVVEGDRKAFANKVILDRITKVIGTSWRVTIPKIYEDRLSGQLFWWETEDHYYQHRSNWDTYFNWLKDNIDPEKQISCFDTRFYHENECLKLLKIGKINEARQRYPNVVDQILTIA